MGLKNGAFATVWTTDKANNRVIDLKEKYAEAFITISKKNKDSGKFETEFADRVRFLGKGFNQIKDMDLHEKDRIKLVSVEVNQSQGTKVKFNNYICWECEKVDAGTQVSVTPKQPEVVEMTELNIDDLGDLPF